MTLDPATLGPCRCAFCWDTGVIHLFRAHDAYERTAEPCRDCENDAIEPGAPCIYCGRASGGTSARSGDPLCPACLRMEAGEDEWSHRWERGDRWVTTLGIGADL